MMAHHTEELKYNTEYCAKRTKNQHKIIIVLMQSSPLSLKELSMRTGIRSRAILKGMAVLVKCRVISKDKHKLYSINPKFGTYLIEEGICILGFQKPPEKVKFIILLRKLRKDVSELFVCLKRVCVFIITMLG